MNGCEKKALRYSPSPMRQVSGALSGLLLLLLQVAQAADVPEFSAAFGREHPLAGAIVQSADLTRPLVKPRGMLSPSCPWLPTPWIPACAGMTEGETRRRRGQMVPCLFDGLGNP